MSGKHYVFAAAPDLPGVSLIYNGQSGPFAELFELVEARK